MQVVKLFSKLIFLTTFLFFISCKKDKNILGVDVQPGVDDLNAENVRGLTVHAHTLAYDSIASIGDNFKFIGSNNDPLFGRTDYGLYLNANMSVSNPFGANAHFASSEIVLAIDAAEYAGNKDAVLSYSVFAVKDKIDKTKFYYTSDARHHQLTPICTHATAFTVTPDGKTVLRIKLDSIYAEKLLHDSLNLISNDVFQKAYLGYYVVASLQNNDEGVIFKANLDDPLSGLYLRYKTDVTSDTILDFKFTFSGSTAYRYNTVKYEPKQIIKDQFADSTLGTTNLFLKGMGITKLKIQIPFLKNHSDSFKIAVNRAEVILHVDPSNVSGNSRYYAPPKLLLLSIDSLSRETYIKDISTTANYNRFDGVYNSSLNAYVFNIALEAQAIFSGLKANRGFYVVVANADLTLNTFYTEGSKVLLPLRRDNYYERVVLAGSNNSALKPVFNLNYIRFKND